MGGWKREAGMEAGMEAGKAVGKEVGREFMRHKRCRMWRLRAHNLLEECLVNAYIDGGN